MVPPSPVRALVRDVPAAPASASALATGAPDSAGAAPIAVPTELDAELAAALPSFEQFFKTFGFKAIHGRVWGLLVLSERPLAARDVAERLRISHAAASTTINELEEWGAVRAEFDAARRCELHRPVGNALSIVATVLRRREQVAFQQFRQVSERIIVYVRARYGERDPRLYTLRSIAAACELAETMLQLIFSAVASALDDPQSLLHRAVTAAFRTGIRAAPGLKLAGRRREKRRA